MLSPRAAHCPSLPSLRLLGDTPVPAQDPLHHPAKGGIRAVAHFPRIFATPAAIWGSLGWEEGPTFRSREQTAARLRPGGNGLCGVEQGEGGSGLEKRALPWPGGPRVSLGSWCERSTWMKWAPRGSTPGGRQGRGRGGGGAHRGRGGQPAPRRERLDRPLEPLSSAEEALVASEKVKVGFIQVPSL